LIHDRRTPPESGGVRRFRFVGPDLGVCDGLDHLVADLDPLAAVLDAAGSQ